MALGRSPVHDMAPPPGASDPGMHAALGGRHLLGRPDGPRRGGLQRHCRRPGRDASRGPRSPPVVRHAPGVSRPARQARLFSRRGPFGPAAPRADPLRPHAAPEETRVGTRSRPRTSRSAPRRPSGPRASTSSRRSARSRTRRRPAPRACRRAGSSASVDKLLKDTLSGLIPIPKARPKEVSREVLRGDAAPQDASRRAPGARIASSPAHAGVAPVPAPAPPPRGGVRRAAARHAGAGTVRALPAPRADRLGRHGRRLQGAHEGRAGLREDRRDQADRPAHGGERRASSRCSWTRPSSRPSSPTTTSRTSTTSARSTRGTTSRWSSWRARTSARS